MKSMRECVSVCVCECVCVCVCVCECVCVCVCVCVHACVSVRVVSFLDVSNHFLIYIWASFLVCIHVYIHKYVSSCLIPLPSLLSGSIQ